MLKYIMLQEPTGEEVARFALAPTKHLELALEAQAHRAGRRVLSAGFVDFIYVVPRGAPPDAGTQLTARTYGFSESLNGLAPRSTDAAFLTAFARATADLAAATIDSTAQPAHP